MPPPQDGGTDATAAAAGPDDTTTSSGSSSGSGGTITVPLGGPFSEAQRELLWNSVTRSLLRLGRAGATESHCRSLKEMLAAHKLVKVQINGPLAGADDVVRQLSDGAGGKLVLAKGSTLLFRERAADPEALLVVSINTAWSNCLVEGGAGPGKCILPETRAPVYSPSLLSPPVKPPTTDPTINHCAPPPRQLASDSMARTAVWREKRQGRREQRVEGLKATVAKREANASRSECGAIKIE